MRSTAGFLLERMRTDAGSFISALDADTDGVEGLTYAWTPQQLVEVLFPGWLAPMPSCAVLRFEPDPADADLANGVVLPRGTGVRGSLRPGGFGASANAPMLRALAHGFTWLRDLRALGTEATRQCARTLVADWIAETARGASM